jgi:hypothetical protein
VPAASILTDDQQSDHIILFGNLYKRFVTSRSPDYLRVIDDPVGRVGFVLVPDDAVAATNSIVKRYPAIYAQCANFLTLEREWPSKC